jgi:hypothetical protein
MFSLLTEAVYASPGAYESLTDYNTRFLIECICRHLENSPEIAKSMDLGAWGPVFDGRSPDQADESDGQCIGAYAHKCYGNER